MGLFFSSSHSDSDISKALLDKVQLSQSYDFSPEVRKESVQQKSSQPVLQRSNSEILLKTGTLLMYYN